VFDVVKISEGIEVIGCSRIMIPDVSPVVDFHHIYKNIYTDILRKMKVIDPHSHGDISKVTKRASGTTLPFIDDLFYFLSGTMRTTVPRRMTIPRRMTAPL
jgi:hypothetical protein